MPVCVAGMHRSGTSMVAKLLHGAGLYLGPRSDLVGSPEKEAEGHWENRRFVRLHERLLKRLGGSWDCPPPAAAICGEATRSAFRIEAATLLRDFSGHEPWGWKDPRNCLFLPLWQSLLDPLPVVVVARNPLEVAQSLQRRNGFSIAHGLALWHVYNQRLIDAAGERIVTHYASWLHAPGSELRRVLDALRLPAEDRVVDGLSGAAVADLRHHQVTAQDLQHAGVDAASLDLYRRLCEEANWVDASLAVRGSSAPADLER